MRFPSYIFDAAPIDERQVLVLRSNADNLKPGFLELWDVNAGERLQQVSAEAELAISLAARGSLAATSSADGAIRIWGVPGLTCVRTIERAGDGAGRLSFLDDERLLAASRTGFDLFDLSSGQARRNFTLDQAGVLGFAVTAGRDRIITACEDRRIRVWETDTGRCIATLMERKLPPYAGRYGAMDVHAVTDVALLPGDLVVASYGDGSLRCWDLASGEMVNKVATSEDATPWLLSLDASPDGRLVIAGSWDHHVWLWDLAGAPQSMSGHIGEVEAVFFLDGRRAVSASFDQTIRVWDAGTRKCERVIGKAKRSSRFPPNESMW